MLPQIGAPELVICLGLLFILILLVVLVTGRTVELTCPKCGTLTKRGGYAGWQIVVAILFFPIGLLALAAGRQPTECMECRFRWQA